jgi:HEAT repeat protein
MLNWLRKLLPSDYSKIQKKDIPSTVRGGGIKDSDSHIHQELSPGPAHEEQNPILVRGMLWKNTEETRWAIPERPEVVHDSGIQDLIKRLARVERAEVRRSAAEKLGELGRNAVPAIPALIQSAIDVDVNVRKTALSALTAIDPNWTENVEARKAFPSVITALKSWSPEVGKAAYKLLNLIGLPAVPDMANALLNQEDTVDKVYVMHILAQIGPDAVIAVPGLTRELNSQFIQSRIAAAEALAKIGPAASNAIPALVAGLSDSYADGRQAMATCLAKIGEAAEPAVPALLPLLTDRHDKVREAVVDALEQIGAKTIPSLIEIVQTRGIQRFKLWIKSINKASQWLAYSRAEILVTDVHAVMGNLSWTVYEIIEEQASLEYAQESALKVLGKLGPASSTAVPAITQALSDPNPRIKIAAIQALGDIGSCSKMSIPGIVQMLLSHEEHIQDAAVKALENIDSNWRTDPSVSHVIAVLASQLSLKNNSGESVVHAFTLIGNTAVPILIEVLESVDQIAQGNAARALGLIGEESQSAIPALTKALENEDLIFRVQDEIIKALTKIQVHST